ncbi:transmembrane protein 65-like [Daphnia pulex]|uniref:transmembrane protein 65-like n=1 Tax=Daphnia pulex TaxID=6669 RepID=UPI001EE06015|nr:transmembrane protein 65-like [Daphnia pulex]
MFHSPILNCISKRNVSFFTSSNLLLNGGKCHLKILGTKKIQTEPSKTDFAQPKPTVNFEKWVANLSPAQQNSLLSTLLKQTQMSSDNSPPPSLRTSQLFHVGIHYSLPFIGFGFLDNFIMIIAGDYIDLTIGSMFGISTMAAAGIGNAISDVAGVGSAQFVESFSQKLGIPQPDLEPRQYAFRSTTWAINIGRAIGVAIGCVLGMVPLLFLPTSDSKRHSKDPSSHL